MMLAVVMQHGVVERIDALEIFGIEHVLGADAMRGLGAEIGLEQLQHRPEHRQAGQAELAAMLLQPCDQVLLEQRVEHDARATSSISASTRSSCFWVRTSG